MEILNSNSQFMENSLKNTNMKNPQFSKNFSSFKTDYSTFQNSNNLNNRPLTSYDRFKSQKLINSAQIRTNHCHKCHPHHFHIHHIHIPQERLYEVLNLKDFNNNSELMKEVLELKNECRKFREELTKNQNEKIAGDLYIKELESQNNNKNKNKNNKNNKYHDMLNKSFEVLNSVSNKCDDEDAKTKGGIYYYRNKENDYNELIKAQKNWIDNLQVNNNIQLQNSNFSNNDYNINNKINEENYQYRKNGKLFFDSKRNNNKGYIIKKGEKIGNYYNQKDENEENIFKNNYNTDPNINNKNRNNHANNISSYQPNINYNSFPQNNNINDDKYNSKENENDNNNKNLINDDTNKEEEENPLNKRYLIVDKFGNPILNNGKKLFGMELIPLIDKNGKEIIDDNGNIVLIGPNGEPKNQNELETIIINNKSLLVNEENKPFLGFNGVPLINSEGNPIVGPDELYDKDNKKIEGIIGFVAKDNKGNPIKINIKEKNNKNKIKNDSINYNNLRPLLDINGKPILDSNNNFIILDKNNKPVQDKEIKVLLSQDGKPILNELGKPILTDKNDNPLNNDIKNDIDNDLRIIKNKTKNRRRNKKQKNIITYDECKPESLKKINFLRPIKDPNYADFEYKGTCFACDAGCSVSKSGYSTMNYSPYNNLIRRRSLTPIKIIDEYDNKNRRYKRKK